MADGVGDPVTRVRVAVGVWTRVPVGVDGELAVAVALRVADGEGDDVGVGVAVGVARGVPVGVGGRAAAEENMEVLPPALVAVEVRYGPLSLPAYVQLPVESATTWPS